MKNPLLDLEKQILNATLLDVEFFRECLRPLSYYICRGDPEKVHALSLQILNYLTPFLKSSSSEFDRPKLRVNLFGKEIMPFGIAAGLDKDGEALYPLSQMFGFLEPGTITLYPREGNPKPRVYSDFRNGTIINSLGFPNKGLENFTRNLEKYRASGGKAPVLASISSVVPEAGAIDIAYSELENIITGLNPFVEGYVWNPYSPNTNALALLRTPEIFAQTAQLIRSRAGPGKASLVKMGPFEQESELEWLRLVGSYLEHGGDGIVAVNTYPIPRGKIPSKSWGYTQGGISGKYLKPYRQKAISLARKEFPSAIIIATGGIDSADDAWDSFSAGADAIEGYTSYIFSGFGLLKEILNSMEFKLADKGYQNLSQLVLAGRNNPKNSG